MTESELLRQRLGQYLEGRVTDMLLLEEIVDRVCWLLDTQGSRPVHEPVAVGGTDPD